MSIFGDSSSILNIVWIVFIVATIFFGPQLMFYQIFMRLSQSANMLEGFAVTGKKTVTRRITKQPSKELKESINNFMEFYAIDPVNTDPYGIMKKVEHIYTLSEKRFNHFAKSVAPNFNEEDKANIAMGLSGAVSLNQIAKVVRHFVEMARKTKSYQWAMVLQMQLPTIERFSKGLLKGTEALTNGWPIGDGIGPMVVANLIGDAKAREIKDEDTLVARKIIKGRTVFIVKAKGPGGRLGKLGRTVERLVKQNKIAKIITIDAAAKLEGEKTGRTAEGIGVAIGGIGVDRTYIENISTSKGLPLDSIVIKMSQEESIMPMKTEILSSLYKVTRIVEDNVANTDEKGSIIIVGVGNTCGIGNNRKAVLDAEKQIRKISAMMIKREKEEKKEMRIYTAE
jgi:hypothetical protein